MFHGKLEVCNYSKFLFSQNSRVEERMPCLWGSLPQGKGKVRETLSLPGFGPTLWTGLQPSPVSQTPFPVSKSADVMETQHPWDSVGQCQSGPRHGETPVMWRVLGRIKLGACLGFIWLLLALVCQAGEWSYCGMKIPH